MSKGNDPASYKTKLVYVLEELDEDNRDGLIAIDEKIRKSKYFYLKPDVSTMLVNKYFLTFTFYGLFTYLVHFSFIATITNMFS